ncbi:hypothetical protein K437DRAFT_256557 [Tilletiaria anomala UBC 951]|uniref:CTLH domain-containing protein n=1 Tax=Tilletiaria anomala (strain ATCC 24038 / CBS 436.72 / UBC 951) TaxID=1037660 RepID=A0A066VVE9_TILAU|nr:uncharacterized protein K437DRAFT_256557 [Tilletiaria anomala UBC 951]KDN45446.1 hypothetical protein K437DRAFT_256557 [Tilletiaria anomala UBC 951]
MSPRRQIRRSEWEKSLNDVQISKADLNRLVMDYLVIEGYKDAAESYATETGISPQVDLESIANRMTVRSAIQRGDIEEAIGRVNELDPEILDTNPVLFFRLQQQRLIELIRTGKVAEALAFAAEELAPRGEEHPELLPELERTMALLVFDTPGIASVGGKSGSHSLPTYISDLLTPTQRLKTAGELNAAILASQSQGKDPKLLQLLRILTFGEHMLGTEGPGDVDFPRLDLSSATLKRSNALGDADSPSRSDAMVL